MTESAKRRVSSSPPPRKRWSRTKRIWVTIGSIGGGLVLVAGVGLVVVTHWVTSYVDPWKLTVAAAGYVEKTARVEEVDFSYVEGPDNGTPLVLLHAQLMDWFTYSRALPALAESYHVFVVDYQGHGKTTYPDDYPMNANRIGTDLGGFIDQVVGEPVFVSGNSSGGLLTVWLAANRPDIVKAIVLEDPPLFAAEYPRIKQTIADKAFASSYNAVQSGYDGDFLMFWLDENKGFFHRYVFPGSSAALKSLVSAYRNANPGEPVQINIIPNETVRLLMRGLEVYDLRFGAAFYDGTWNDGFNHAESLQRIACPALLLHARYTWTEDGTLDGAMSQEDSDKAMSLLSNGTYIKVDSGHVIHIEHPGQFVDILYGFLIGG